MALPCGTTGSLCSTFVPDRHVRLPVKRPCAIALSTRLPTVLRAPLEASVTLLEATTPVKLPTTHCPLIKGLGPGRTKAGISTAAPPRLAARPQGLPAILHIGRPGSIRSYSKGARGLFVPLRVTGI